MYIDVAGKLLNMERFDKIDHTVDSSSYVVKLYKEGSDLYRINFSTEQEMLDCYDSLVTTLSGGSIVSEGCIGWL
jgi:hypothetical protein